MSQFLCVTVRFLQPFSHGRGEDAEPEWPPSPLRLFQALVAAAAARWNERQRIEYAQPALQWLAQLGAPVVVAAVGTPAPTKYRLYVPDNVGDKVAKSWVGGNSAASIAEYRTEKDVRPVHLNGEAVHYLFPITDPTACGAHFETLRTAARSVTHLGWGVDMVAGNAELLSDAEAAKLVGERWQPTPDGSGTRLRVPTSGTLSALMSKHEAFLNRLSGDGFRPVPPLTAFATVGYRRDTDIAPRPWAAFAILKPDQSGNRSFDTARRCRDVAAWVRHATGTVCADWPDVAAFVHGHAEANNPLRGERADERFMYLPLPTINSKLNRVESIRRVLVAAPAGFRDRIEWIRRRLPGQELVWDGEAVGLLNLLPTSDWVLRQYTGTACVWSTVTPVVLPGHDDRDPAKAEGLLRRALAHAGFPSTEAQGTAVEFRGVGFRSGVDLASQYATSEHTKGPRYHVRVRFAHAVTGPVVVGNGRYRGFGLFATE